MTNTNGWRNAPTNPSSDQLAAVNELLQSIGQAPVSTLDTSNPDVSIAWNTLVSTSRDVQAEGWTFNKEYHVQVSRSAEAGWENYILIADNELQIDLVPDISNINHDAVIRANTLTNGTVKRFLYDREQHSNTWDYDPYVDKVFYFDWETLPVPIQSYIIAKACTICSSRIVGDTNQYQLLKQREDYTRTQALEYETQQGDFNYLGVNSVETSYKTFEPTFMLSRY